MDGLDRPSHMVMENESPTGPEHAKDLLIEPSLVWNVHRGALCPDDIEAMVRERHRLRVTLLEGHTITQTHPRRERRPSAAKRLAEIEYRHMAAKTARQDARWPTQPAANIKRFLIRADCRERHQFKCRLETTRVKLIRWREVFHSERAGIFAHGA